MTQLRKEQFRVQTKEQIKATAWKQIGERGATAVSLRAIAHELGMTAPSLYYYYKDRDALVTDLMMEAFHAFTAALEAARDAHKPKDHAGRFRGVCRAYFQWAAANPQRYVLLFDTPVQGYLFAEELGPVAQKSFLVLLQVIGEANTAGKLSGGNLKLPADLKNRYTALKDMGMPYSGIITQVALSVWSMMHGITSLYLHNYLTGFLQADLPSFVNFEIEKLALSLGLE